MGLKDVYLLYHTDVYRENMTKFEFGVRNDSL
jgi:hypothetical protein